MLAFIAIILLILIAVGVLLMSEAGKKILRGLGWLALIGVVLFILFWLVIFGYAFLNSPIAMAQLNGLENSIFFIIFLLSFVVFAWLTIRFFRSLFFEERPRIFTWREREEIRTRLSRFSSKHSGLVGGLILLWLVVLIFLSILPKSLQTPALAILGWPLLLIFAFLLVILILGRSKIHKATAPKER